MHNRIRTRIISNHLIPLELSPTSAAFRKRRMTTPPTPSRLSTPDLLERGAAIEADRPKLRRSHSSYERAKAACRQAWQYCLEALKAALTQLGLREG